MDVTNIEQAKIAEEAGAVAVMALESVPSDIRRDGGVARMSDPAKVLEASINLGDAMSGLEISEIQEGQLLAGKGLVNMAGFLIFRGKFWNY